MTKFVRCETAMKVSAERGIVRRYAGVYNQRFYNAQGRGAIRPQVEEVDKIEAARLNYLDGAHGVLLRGMVDTSSASNNLSLGFLGQNAELRRLASG